jgi:hypothetical protein
MSEVAAFKLAFLTRCAEEGLTVDQIHERVKVALAKAEAKFGATKEAAPIPGLGSGIANMMARVLNRFGVPAGIGLGIGVGPRVYDALAAPAAAGTQAYLQSDGSIPAALAGAGTAGALENWGNKLIPAAAIGLGAGGLLLGKHMATTQEDPLAADEIKHQELMNEYDRLAKRVSTASKRRKLLENRG